MIRRVVGHSMAPTLQQGKVVFALKWLRPKVGSVVVVRRGERELIKRVTALQSNQLYVVGDNRKASTDSRHFGWLPLSAMLGVVIGTKRHGQSY